MRLQNLTIRSCNTMSLHLHQQSFPLPDNLQLPRKSYFYARRSLVRFEYLLNVRHCHSKIQDLNQMSRAKIYRKTKNLDPQTPTIEITSSDGSPQLSNAEPSTKPRRNRPTQTLTRTAIVAAVQSQTRPRTRLTKSLQVPVSHHCQPMPTDAHPCESPRSNASGRPLAHRHPSKHHRSADPLRCCGGSFVVAKKGATHKEKMQRSDEGRDKCWMTGREGVTRPYRCDRLLVE